jgi:RNA polymerase sigma factor (sigma-70 family)
MRVKDGDPCTRVAGRQPRGQMSGVAAVSYDLGALYLRHREAMHRVAASVLHSAGLADDAGDAVHEAILSIMKSPPTDVLDWEAFLVTAVKRKALDRVKSAPVRHAGPELTERHDHTDNTDIAEDVADDLDRQRLAAVAWDCLSVLDERHRKAVWEFAALGRARDEIATELGVTPARISQMTRRALELLQQEMSRREGKRWRTAATVFLPN